MVVYSFQYPLPPISQWDGNKHQEQAMSVRQILVWIAVLATVVMAADGKPYLISKSGTVPVWLGPEHREYVQVVTKNGARGWVESSKVRTYEQKTGTNVDLGEGRLDGHLDNPGDVYILTDDSKIPPEGFFIVRDLTTFVLADMIDRETLERRYHENF
jgi:hypothetical protein